MALTLLLHFFPERRLFQRIFDVFALFHCADVPALHRSVYTPEYIARLEPTELANIEADVKSYSDNDIKQSIVLEYGASYFYRQIAEKTGLYHILQESMPDCWQDVFTAACYLVSNDEPHRAHGSAKFL